MIGIMPITKALPLQPPAATASFFERMKFIIEDQGLQSYVQRKGFNERSVRCCSFLCLCGHFRCVGALHHY